jgi:hypothetical protein
MTFALTVSLAPVAKSCTGLRGKWAEQVVLPEAEVCFGPERDIRAP